MAPARILNLLALTALATLLTTFSAQPVQALEQRRAVQFGRRSQHHNIAENQLIKKRSSSKKCRARPSTAKPEPTSTQQDSPKPTSTQKSQPKPTQSQPQPQPPKSPPSSPSGGGDIFGTKLGLAWSMDDNDLKNFKGVGWAYNWQSNKPASADGLGINYFPQIWGWKNKDDFIRDSQNSNAKLFLGPNEPNEPGQANLSVESGIELWRETMTPLKKKGKKLCSPVTSSNPNGLTWVSQFKKKCGSDCDWDFTCVHWYDTTFEKFKDYCTKWHDTFGLPILVTEFAPQNFNGGAQPSSGDVWNFMQKAIPWLESTEWIHAYAPYGYMNPLNINQNAKLVGDNNKPNSLGSWVLNAAGI